MDRRVALSGRVGGDTGVVTGAYDEKCLRLRTHDPTRRQQLARYATVPYRCRAPKTAERSRRHLAASAAPPHTVAAVAGGDGATDAVATAAAGFVVITTGVFSKVPTKCFTLNPADGALVEKTSATGLT
jgi:hypothetical protein|eukprot:COSAG01_NODE_10578_length_2129_cov_9.838424_2_plen_129_part_00